MGNCLYSPGEWTRCNVNVVGDQILCRQICPMALRAFALPLRRRELQLIFEDLIDVKLVDALCLPCMKGVVTFPLDRPEEKTVIWTVLPDVRYYEYIPFEDGVILHIEDSTPEDYVYASCLYYCGTDGTRKLLDHNIGKYGNVYFNLQVSEGVSILAMIQDLIRVLRYIRIIWIRARKRYAVSSLLSIAFKSMEANYISVFGAA